jgi:hypothetical protein
MKDTTNTENTHPNQLSEEPTIPLTQNLPQLQATPTTSNSEGASASTSEGAGKDLDVIPNTNASAEGDKDAIASGKDKEVVTKSGRISKPPACFDDYVSIESVFSIELDCYEHCDHPIVFTASTDPDVLHYHEAMKQPDRVQFIRAMVKEIQAHTDGKNWIIVKRSSVPRGHQVLPAVWAMRRKRKIDTREVYKWKARINIHGGKQTKGINYCDLCTSGYIGINQVDHEHGCGIWMGHPTT